MPIQKVFKPGQPTFGLLSNHSKMMPIVIDGEYWPTVTNYLYAKMIRSPYYKDVLKRVPLTLKEDNRIGANVKREFANMEYNEVKNAIQAALSEAVPIKFKDSSVRSNESSSPQRQDTKDKILKETDDIGKREPTLIETLRESGNRRFVYVSPDAVLGTGVQLEGLNMYGKILSQLRHQMRVQSKLTAKKKDTQEYEDSLYKIFIAENALKDAMYRGDDLSSYMNMTVDEIIDKIGNETRSRMPSKEVVISLFNSNHLDPVYEMSIDNPQNLVLYVRKKGIRAMKRRQEDKRVDIVFRLYVEYMIEKHLANEQEQYYKTSESEVPDNFATVAIQQLFKSSPDGRSEYETTDKSNDFLEQDLKARVYKLYEAGYLSARLSEYIRKKLEDIHVPTSAEVESAESITIEPSNALKAVIEPTYAPDSNNQPISIYPVNYPEPNPKYALFGPDAFSGMLTINSRIFPTVMHYIYYVLMEKIIGLSPEDAYKTLLADPEMIISGLESFLSPDDVDARYRYLKLQSYERQMKKNVKKALKAKFSNRQMQDVLLMTGDNPILWDDHDDPILGSGPKDYRGQNIVGEEMVKIREKIKADRGSERVDQIREEDVSSILVSHPFLFEWAKMRIIDMCQSISDVFVRYKMRKDNGADITPDIAKEILDLVYQPCSQLIGMSDNVVAPVPLYFTSLIKNYPGFSKAYSGVDEVIWKRIVVMIHVLVSNISEINSNSIKETLVGIESTVTALEDCVKIIDGEENCVVSALVNILVGLRRFYQYMAVPYNLEEDDVMLATRLILTKDADDEFAIEEPVIVNEDVQEDGNYLIDDEILDPEHIEIFDRDDDDNEIGDYQDEMREDDIEDVWEKEHAFGFSGFSDHSLTMLKTHLEESFDIDNPEELAKIIMNAVEIIKTYPMDENIKRNRINFFATTKF